MIQTVLKRDGRIVGFNEEKIVTAIRKAMLHTDKGEDMQLIRQITTTSPLRAMPDDGGSHSGPGGNGTDEEQP